MPSKNRPRGKQVKSFESSPEDRKLIQEIKARTGMKSDSDVMRLALRRFAQAEGILANIVSAGQTQDAAELAR